MCVDFRRGIFLVGLLAFSRDEPRACVLSRLGPTFGRQAPGRPCRPSGIEHRRYTVAEAADPRGSRLSFASNHSARPTLQTHPKTTHIYFRPPNRRGRAVDRSESRFVPLSHPFDGKTRKIRARRGVWTLIRRRIDTVRLAGPPRVHPNRHPRPSPRAQRRAWAERARDESCDRWRRRSGPAAGVSREKNKSKMS